MSLEDKIQGLTDAVEALTAALAHPYPTLSDRADTRPVRLDTRSSRRDALSELAKAEVAPPKPQVTPEIIPAVSTPTAPAGPSAAEPVPSLTIDYAQVAKAITDTFKVDRAKTINALAKFGAAKGPQLKPEDYAAFLKELSA